MNSQLTAAIRYFLTAIFSYGAGKGWFSAEQVPDLVNGILTVAGAAVPLAMTIWGIFRASKTARTASVQASKTEQVYTTDPAVAAAAPGARLVDKLPPPAPTMPGA